MKKKAIYYVLSALVLFSGTFSAAPMAFCMMKASAGTHSCCKSPAAPVSKSSCPITKYQDSKLDPVTFHKVSSVLPEVNISVAISHDVALNAFEISTLPLLGEAFSQSSPPIYQRLCTFRI